MMNKSREHERYARSVFLVILKKKLRVETILSL
jgi:hypothetical protein